MFVKHLRKGVLPFGLLIALFSPISFAGTKPQADKLVSSPNNSITLLKEDLQQNFKNCGLTEKAQKLARLIIFDPQQQRQLLICNPLLAKIAQEKAQEMAKLGRVSHVGTVGANHRLRESGYLLHSDYPRLFANNVEAIAGGTKEPEKMWQLFKGSSGHRTHLLAEHEFYQIQNEIGVGFYKDLKSPHVYYWVVYIAHEFEMKTFKGKIAPSKD